MSNRSGMKPSDFGEAEGSVAAESEAARADAQKRVARNFFIGGACRKIKRAANEKFAAFSFYFGLLLPRSGYGFAVSVPRTSRILASKALVV